MNWVAGDSGCAMAAPQNGAKRALMIGCGIFRAEIEFLTRLHGWNLDTEFLDVALHVDLKALQGALTRRLQQHGNGHPFVFYGCCHPLMDRMLAQAQTFRTEGQNCLEMLLGAERFEAELSAGAFFLLEPWALSWIDIQERTFGKKWDITRAIFHENRKFLLAIRTPLSGDFTAAAETAAASIDLPLHWTEVGLEHLEVVLLQAMRRQQQARQQP